MDSFLLDEVKPAAERKTIRDLKGSQFNELTPECSTGLTVHEGSRNKTNEGQKKSQHTDMHTHIHTHTHTHTHTLQQSTLLLTQ